jgi:hypothetical protein
LQTANPSTVLLEPSMANSTSAASTSSTGQAVLGLLPLPPFLVFLVVVLRPLVGLRPPLAGAGVVLVVDLELV